VFLERLIELTKHHSEHCASYKRLVGSVNLASIKSIEQIPFVHVSIFKETLVSSIDDKDVFKTLRSSGTAGTQSVIKIDKHDALKQSASLSRLYKACVTDSKRDMLYIDKDVSDIVKREGYNARVAGITGFGVFCNSRASVIDERDTVKSDVLKSEALRNVLLFGFTPKLWQHSDAILECGVKCDDLIVLHGGGWKKLESLRVSRQEFDDKMFKLGATKVINYFGMVEQLGSVYFSCKNGHFHVRGDARAIARDITSLKPIENQLGVMQFLSVIPGSYPGHSILTDDLGIMHTGLCGCGDENKHFTIIGRYKNAIIRGCGNT
jgi:hypothetical protein